MSRARAAWVVSTALMLGCGTSAQRVDSPCTREPSSTDPSACPACDTDADCSNLGNLCVSTASCVPTRGNWPVVTLSCEASAKYSPPVVPCRCVERVCQAAITAAR